MFRDFGADVEGEGTYAPDLNFFGTTFGRRDMRRFRDANLRGQSREELRGVSSRSRPDCAVVMLTGGSSVSAPTSTIAPGIESQLYSRFWADKTFRE